MATVYTKFSAPILMIVIFVQNTAFSGRPHLSELSHLCLVQRKFTDDGRVV